MNRIVIALLKPFSFIPAILMMSLIFSFSSQNGTESSQLSEKVARGIFITIDHVMDRGWDDEKIQELADEYQYPVRKLAHMTEYCLLAICVSLPLYVYGLRGFALTFLAGILCVAFAASDEFHQTMVANRGPSVKDVGIEGEVVQCIPTSEWSYASNQRNFDTISIECCHPDDSGEFTDETYNSVVQLAGFLCKRFNLTSDDVIRHYDVTEKLCPLYYVEHEDAWIQMKADIQAYADSLS